MKFASAEPAAHVPDVPFIFLVLQEKGLDWESFFEKVRYLRHIATWWHPGNLMAESSQHSPSCASSVSVIALHHVHQGETSHSLQLIRRPLYRLQLKKNGQWHVEVY